MPFEVKSIALIGKFKGMLTTLHSNEQLEFLEREMLQIKTVVESICSKGGKDMKEDSLPGSVKKIVQ